MQFVVGSRKMTELLQHRQVSDVVDVVVVDSEDAQGFLEVKIIVKLLSLAVKCAAIRLKNYKKKKKLLKLHLN